MNLASVIDHTILKPDCTISDIQTLCQEALDHGFGAVCIPPYYVSNAAELLNESSVSVATVIGFPMGYAATVSKVEEIKRALSEGAQELDAVINISAVKNGDWSHVRNDIDSMTHSAHLRGKLVKITLETGMMTTEELLKLCEICAANDVDFVKSSTGFNAGGATKEHVELLRKNLPAKTKIIASGGIRSRAFAEELIAAGADRIASSSSINLITTE